MDGSGGRVGVVGSDLGQIWWVPAVVALAVAVLIVGAVISVPVVTGAATGHNVPQKVQLVGPGGKPLNVANGSLGSVILPAAKPFHVQVGAGDAQGTDTPYNLLTSIPAGATVSISSVTLTCEFCQPSASTSSTGAVDALIYQGSAASCPGAPTVGPVVALLQANSSQPSVEFTYPTPRTAPLGFTPKASWCLGVDIAFSAGAHQAFFTVDGTEN